MLCCPLFSRLHQQAINGNRNVFSKVKAIPGDLSQPGLGVTEADAAIIQSSVDIIIHCAANVVLDADIQGTLRYVACLQHDNNHPAKRTRPEQLQLNV